MKKAHLAGLTAAVIILLAGVLPARAESRPEPFVIGKARVTALPDKSNDMPLDVFRGADGGEMLAHQPRPFSFGPDVGYGHGLSRDHGEGQRGPQNLSAAFSERAVDGYHGCIPFISVIAIQEST